MHVFFNMCILIFLFAQCGRRGVVSPSGELCLSSCDNRDKLSINSGNSYMMAQYCSYLTLENLYIIMVMAMMMINYVTQRKS